MLSWLKQEATDAARSALHDFLKEHLPEWKRFVKETVCQGLEWGLRNLKTLKAKIMKVLTEKPLTMSSIVVAGSKAVTRKVITKGIAKKTATTVAKKTATTVTKKVISEATEKVTITLTETVVAKTVTGTVASGAGKSALKAANPVGYISDAAQLGLELAGYNNAGKAVGASGNLVSGGMTGMALGGPPGAIVGALAGLGFWYVGEKLGDLMKLAFN